MTQELRGIAALRQNINDTWDADSHIIKDKFMEDPDYEWIDDVTELARNTSEALSGGGLSRQELSDILADYYAGKVGVDDPDIVGDINGDDFRGNIDKVLNAIVYEQAQQIFSANYENDKIEWQEEYDEKLDAEDDDLEP